MAPLPVLLVTALALGALGQEADTEPVILLQRGFEVVGDLTVNATAAGPAAVGPANAAPAAASLPEAASHAAAKLNAASFVETVPLVTPRQSVPGMAFSWSEAAAEYLTMTLYVIMGCGSAMAIAKDAGSAWVLQVALVFGLSVTTLYFGLGHYSGGQMNCALTLGLLTMGRLAWEQALLNFAAQMLGSITGALILCLVFPAAKDKTGCLGANGVAVGFHPFGALLAEFVMTFVVMITVLQSGVLTPAVTGISVIPVGLAVFVAHAVLIPIDGCSINPTRSFGPALVATFRYHSHLDEEPQDEDTWQSWAATLRTHDKTNNFFHDMWIFWVGPIAGALAAVGIHTAFTA
mmetsp:Transcript_99216/g.305879  ORF Transcript_99216/g.305879 Transcript_99216/m.305879 type:complete len:349 (-) Transcript_99216:19-1065(-)